MASVHKDPRNRSPFWYAAFTLPDGTRCFKSTKLVERKKAFVLALEWERLGRDAAEQDPVGAQISKVNRDIYERTTGIKLEIVHVGTHLRAWAKRSSELKAKRTGERYSQVVEDFLKHLGRGRERANLNSISTADVQAFISSEHASGKASTTIEMLVKVLRAPFNQAFRQGLIAKNPVAGVEIPQGYSEQRDVFTWAQVGMLLEVAQGEWKTAILLSVYCGMRLGDCVNLKWSNIDLGAGVITFVPEKTSRGKRRKELTVPIHPTLRAHLDRLAGSDSPEQRLCPGLQVRGSSGRNGLSMEFIHSIMKEAGIATEAGERKVKGKGRTFNKLSFHSLRHTFNSELANQGVPQDVRRMLTGHSSDRMNDRYSHFDGKTLVEAVQKLPHAHR
ncbi:MAG: hypothetical protein JWM35_416 [Verrucomicrobia bacterium]|nr:hypothetical protein [Verrucomicrobiota bacterium]